MSFFIHFFTQLAPDRFFVICALVFGLVFIVVTPPFQTPDEFNHFYRAYQISEGNLITLKKDNRVGGELPISLVKISEPFRAMPMKGYVTTRWSVIAEQFNVPLREDQKVFIDFPNTGMYSPVSYLPQALSILVLRTVHLPPMCIFYGARVLTLFFWIFCMAFIIRWIPIYQWLFTLLALLPMSISTHMSLSADVMTNLLSFAVIAYSFELAYRQTIVSIRQILLFILLGVALALAKVVYLPMILLFFLIPQEKFVSKPFYYKSSFLLFGFSFAAALLWSIGMKNLYVPHSLYNPEFRERPIMGTCISSCANMEEQLHYIMTHGWYVVEVFVYSTYYAFNMYFRGYIGTLGWLDTYLWTGFIYIAYFIILLVVWGDANKNIRLGGRFKILSPLIFFVILTLILLTQLLTWSCVGAEYIYIIQGRYVIPILPLLLMLLYTDKWTFAKWKTACLVVVFSCLSLLYTAGVILERYFAEDEVQLIDVRCDAENVIDGDFATDSIGFLFKNGNTQSSEKARSGKYAAKINSKVPYTFTYSLWDCKAGDSLTIQVDRFGKMGGIIISGADNSFSLFAKDPVYTDSLGWDHLQSNILIPHDMRGKEISIFIYYNEGKDSSYFDNMRITYRKLK